MALSKNYSLTLGGVLIFKSGVFQRIIAPACHYTKFSKKNVQGLWRFISREEFQRVDVEYMTDMAKVFALFAVPNPTEGETAEHAVFGVVIGGNSMYKAGDHRTAVNTVVTFANLTPSQVKAVLDRLDSDEVKQVGARYRAKMSSLLIQIGDSLAVEKGELTAADVAELNQKISNANTATAVVASPGQPPTA